MDHKLWFIILDLIFGTFTWPLRIIKPQCKKFHNEVRKWIIVGFWVKFSYGVCILKNKVYASCLPLKLFKYSFGRVLAKIETLDSDLFQLEVSFLEMSKVKNGGLRRIAPHILPEGNTLIKIYQTHTTPVPIFPMTYRYFPSTATIPE